MNIKGAGAPERKKETYMLKKFALIALCLTGISLGYSNPEKKEDVKEWSGSNASGRLGLRIGSDSVTGPGATITLACSIIHISDWKTDGSAMTGVEASGLPILNNPQTTVKVTAKHSRTGLRLTIVGDGSWVLEPGAGIQTPLCL